MQYTYIIAEAGVNHNGQRDLAFQLVDAAVTAGVDAVKFQTFNAEKLVTKSAVKADYQQKMTGSDDSQYAMLKKLELDHQTHRELIQYCQEQGVEFLSTAFDEESLDFLANGLGLQIFKLPSGEITNGPLLLAHARLGRNIILSTGMATLGEVEEALGVLTFGMLHGQNTKPSPSRSAFREAYASAEGQQLLREKVTLLHCTTEYPAPVDEINLNAMQTMRSEFGLQTGYSDHSEGITVPVAATAMGATLIEKHFTLDRELPGPDHKASLEPDELAAMVRAIRVVEQAMGDGIKSPTISELENRPIVRKSLVAAEVIQPGAVFSERNIVIKRPGTGISPMEYWEMLGKTSHTLIGEDEVLRC